MPYQIDQIDPTKTVLIVVDMQNDFVAEGAKLRSAAAATMVPKLASTLKFCRDKGIRIIYTAHVHRRDGSDMGLYDDLYPPIADHSTLVDGTPGIEIFRDLAPLQASTSSRSIAIAHFSRPTSISFFASGESPP
jgi:biuret amidohydrolase